MTVSDISFRRNEKIKEKRERERSISKIPRQLNLRLQLRSNKDFHFHCRLIGICLDQILASCMIKWEVLEWKYIRSEKVNVSGITRFIHHASGLFRSNYARQTLPLDTLFFSHMDIEERRRGFWCSSKTCSTSRKKQCPHICPDRASPTTRASHYLWFTSLIATQQNRDQAKWNDKRLMLLLQNLFPPRSRYTSYIA